MRSVTRPWGLEKYGSLWFSSVGWNEGNEEKTIFAADDEKSFFNRMWNYWWGLKVANSLLLYISVFQWCAFPGCKLLAIKRTTPYLNCSQYMPMHMRWIFFIFQGGDIDMYLSHWFSTCALSFNLCNIGHNHRTEWFKGAKIKAFTVQ